MEDIKQTIKAIKELLSSQRFATLATENDQGIHTTLVAFTIDSSLHHIYFCTPKSTRKYENLHYSSSVSLLVHNSVNKDEDITRASAVSITGTATILSGEEKELAQKYFLEKHGYFRDMMNSPEVAYISVEVTQYDLVSNFQDVRTVVVRGE